MMQHSASFSVHIDCELVVIIVRLKAYSRSPLEHNVAIHTLRIALIGHIISSLGVQTTARWLADLLVLLPLGLLAIAAAVVRIEAAAAAYQVTAKLGFGLAASPTTIDVSKSAQQFGGVANCDDVPWT
jgi:hypothetical protein